MHVLAGVSGVPVLGMLIDIGALVSLFAGTLACITAAARVLLLMSHNGLAHGSFRATHALNETPGRAIMVTGFAAVLPVAVLAARGASGLDVYGWMGSLATYGFIVTYALVCIASAALLARPRCLPPGSADHSLDRLRCHGAGVGRESLSRARRALRQAALHLPGLPGGGTALVSAAWAG